MRITNLDVNHLRLPLPKQRISLTDPLPNREEFFHVLVVTLSTDVGLEGLGFTHGGFGVPAMQAFIEHDLRSLLIGEDPRRNELLWTRAQQRFRSIGWSGIAARAYAAIDISLWDIKAKAANLPLFRLLGGSRTTTAAYLTDIASPGHEPTHTLKIAKPLMEAGGLGVLVEVGGADIQLDADRVQQIRDGLGEDAWLGIAVEGRYDLGTAMAMAHFYEEDVGIDRYDSPLPWGDTKGYQRLAERMEVPLALGCRFDHRDEFRRLLEAGDVRVLRPNVLRLGGLTPLLKIAAFAEAYPVTITPYRLPEIAVHLACGLPNIDAIDFTNVLAPLWSEPLRIDHGGITPREKPGHGFELTREALDQFSHRR